MIVAIDGPAGSGKSTIARELASRLGFAQLDTGALYRAVTNAALSRGVDIDDERAIAQLAARLSMRFTSRAGEETHLEVDGRDVTREIRTAAVDRAVSKVSSNPGVRTALLDAQRQAAIGRDIVAEGRDIGTVVFPDAEVKVFLTADPVERARRRALQRHGTSLDSRHLDAESRRILADIKRRDTLDANRRCAPLSCAADAVRIDSTACGIDEVLARITSLIDDRR
ncbi:cytidylate kinase [Coriobacterium glomerans PW2]|uniref:Cytidylate kinase n=1 Tax=Coriobacterium glomerans (strain ATCC 49209 / DSM 20642 / JCM 10262 / PW2) TaxID=700015 RepID=F2N9I8_CORGP|nr:(d)CMP kinase [Coriobacterium glomerans]AEB07017.1 cytidylate kinase [Coriobacterium glomerans PW2]